MSSCRKRDSRRACKGICSVLTHHGLAHLLWVGVGDIEPLTQQLVWVPLERVSGELPKHLHLHRGLLVSEVILERDAHFRQVVMQ